MFYIVYRVLGRLAQTYNAISTYCYQLYPSYIEHVVAIRPDDYAVEEVYTSSLGLPAWSSAKVPIDIRHVYYIRAYNHMKQGYQEFFLSGLHISQAIRQQPAWCFSDAGLMYLLSKYIYSHKRPENILCITLDGIDITHQIKPLLPSLMVPDNLCPLMVKTLYEHLTGDRSAHYKIKNLHATIEICDDVSFENRTIEDEHHIT